MVMENEKTELITVREFDMKRDARAVEEMELKCEFGGNDNSSKGVGEKKASKKSVSLIVDQMGDPMCRIRHSPEHVMMIAEYGDDKEIVGVVRASIKVVTRGSEPATSLPLFARVAYVLGLRVSPTHRRMGIGTKLVIAAEDWCRRTGAQYSYVATDPTNTASLKLFTGQLGYTRFRSPLVLVRPVHAHRLPIGRSSAAVLRLSPSVAASLYRNIFLSSSEFFPIDEIGSVLSSPLSIATLLALPRSSAASWDPEQEQLPESFAVASLWNCGGVYKLKMKGAPAIAKVLLALARALDARVPWMRVPSVRDVIDRPFGVCLMYGLHARGANGLKLARVLCRVAHNVARESEPDCAAVVAEVGKDDPIAAAVPHWKRFSCEDVWCMKRLGGGGGDGSSGEDNWVKTPATTDVIFVDPRDC